MANLEECRNVPFCRQSLWTIADTSSAWGVNLTKQFMQGDFERIRDPQHLHERDILLRSLYIAHIVAVHTSQGSQLFL